jgi:hypothetical protein
VDQRDRHHARGHRRGCGTQRGDGKSRDGDLGDGGAESRSSGRRNRMIASGPERGDCVGLAAKFVRSGRCRRGGQDIGQPLQTGGWQVTALAVEQALEVISIRVERIGGHGTLTGAAGAAGVTTVS